MNRQADGARLIHQASLNCLTNPPSRVSGKTKASLRIEFLHGMDQTQITLFHQVQQRQTAIGVAASNLDYQAQIALDHFCPGFLAAFLCQTGIHLLLVGGEQL